MTVTATDIRNAAATLEGNIIRTPFIEAPMLSRILGCDLTLKLENLQHTSSFKARGAYNAMQALDDASRQRGVITRAASQLRLAQVALASLTALAALAALT